MIRLGTALLLMPAMACAGILLALPAHADQTHFTLRLSAMHVDGDARINGAARYGGEDFGYSGERFEFGDQTGPRVEGILRLGTHHRVLFNYFRYQRDRHYSTDHDFDVDGIIVPVRSEASTRVRTGLGTVIYDYAWKETPTLSLGLQIGAAWGQLEGQVQANSGPLSVRTRQGENGFAPVLGARLSTHNADKRWGFTVQGQYVNASWGNFDTYSGDMTRLNALLEYRFNPHFGVHAGYDWFRLNVDHDFGPLDAGIILRFMGPMAGLTFVF